MEKELSSRSGGSRKEPKGSGKSIPYLACLDATTDGPSINEWLAIDAKSTGSPACSEKGRHPHWW